MAGMEAGSVDAVVTDPPYGLNFMGKKWDAPGSFVERRPETGTTFDHIGGNHHACNPHDGARSTGRANRRAQDWHHAWAVAALRVLKPSHYLLAFGGTRTWHRLACALEDAGFEIRDTLMWLYGSGFPKGKACLKPAWEPVILARKPGPMRELGIDECRVSIEGCIDPTRRSYNQPGNGLGRGEVYAGGFSHTYTGSENPHPDSPRHHAEGRWPANLVLDEEAGRELDGAVGTLTTNPGTCRNDSPTGSFGVTRRAGTTLSPGDSGGPSRFFYCAKASRRERNAGLEGMEAKAAEWDHWVASGTNPGGISAPRTNHHPTVKPVALMQWLVRLVAREGDLVLDPFLGSGTTGAACAEEGRDFIGIEKEAEYVEIARRRIEAAAAQERLPV